MSEILNSRTLHVGWINLHRLEVRLASGQIIDREVEDHGHGVAVLPFDPVAGIALLVRQTRGGVLLHGQMTGKLLEAPAGMVDPGEDPETAVRRESLEEIGVVLTDLIPLGSAYSLPSRSTETITLFLAPFSAADRVSAGGGIQADGEDIEIEEIGLTELAALVDRCEMPDMKTMVLIAALRRLRPELFV